MEIRCSETIVNSGAYQKTIQSNLEIIRKEFSCSDSIITDEIFYMMEWQTH